MSDMTELYNRDPLKLTDNDIDKIIADMRSKRQLYKAAPATVAAGKKLTDAQEKAAKLDIDFNL